MTQPLAINITSLSKRLGRHQILENLSFQLPQGQISGIRGVNGAGKSILFRLIAGLIHADKGTITIFNQQIGREIEFAPATGLIIDTPGFLPHYSGFKNLQLLAMIRNEITKAQISEAIHAVGLDAADRKPVRTYSTGMRQRLAVAQAIMEAPKLLLLDEPTSAMDSYGRQIIYTLLKKMQSDGVTILITSHHEEEILTLCDAVYEIQNRQLILS